METVKIVTINTWKCDGDYPARMRILAQQLKDLMPDIIACQECFYSEDGDADTLQFLATQLGMNFSFLAGRSKKRRFNGHLVDSTSGLGVLSRYPVKAIGQLDLPAVGEDNDRKAQQVQITLPTGVNITVTNTHLTHLSNPKALRVKQAEALAGFVNATNTSPYHIICGDFNSTTASEEIKTFMQESNAVDCYTAGNGAEPRYSLADGYYKADKQVCVDHIFALPMQGSNTYPQFKNAAVVLNIADGESGLYPSDHFGITTTLFIP